MGSTDLSVTVAAEGEPLLAHTLTCDPAGGSHPDPQRACDALERMADPFGAPPKYDTCSAEGITLTATVRGFYREKVVSADFNQGGCEKYRWG